MGRSTSKVQTLSTIRRVCTSAAAPLPPEKQQRHCIGHHALKSFQQSPPQKKDTESIGIDLLLEGSFFEGWWYIFCVKTCPFEEPALPTNWWRVSTTPTSKFLNQNHLPCILPSRNSSGLLACDQIRDRYGRSTMTALGCLVSARCFSRQFPSNNQFFHRGLPRRAKAQTLIRKFPLVQWRWKDLEDDLHFKVISKHFKKGCL